MNDRVIRVGDMDSGEETIAQYPIRTVSTLTGVNPVTLRAWERRYGLIKPARTPKGHRLYSQRQIERIQRTLELLQQGISIGQVRQFIEPAERGPAVGEIEPPDPWQQYSERMWRAIERFDDAALDRVYHEVLSLYPVDLATNRLIVPLVRKLGEAWCKSEAGIAQEHFFMVFLRNELGARFHHLSRWPDGPRLLLACIPGEFHEIGMLLFGLAALAQGYRILLLGANMPLEELPVVAHKADVAAVVLSASMRPPRRFFERELPPLVDRIVVPVFVGGNGSELRREEIAACGATALGGDHSRALGLLREHLASG